MCVCVAWRYCVSWWFNSAFYCSSRRGTDSSVLLGLHCNTSRFVRAFSSMLKHLLYSTNGNKPPARTRGQHIQTEHDPLAASRSPQGHPVQTIALFSPFGDAFLRVYLGRWSTELKLWERSAVHPSQTSEWTADSFRRKAAPSFAVPLLWEALKPRLRCSQREFLRGLCVMLPVFNGGAVFVGLQTTIAPPKKRQASSSIFSRLVCTWTALRTYAMAFYVYNLP